MRKLPLLFLLLLISFTLHAQQDHYLNSKSTRAEYSASQLPAPEIQQSSQRYTLKWHNLNVYLTAYPNQTQDDYSFGSSNQSDPQKEAEEQILHLIQQQGIYPQLQQLNQQQSYPLPESQLKPLYRQLKGELPAPRIIRSQTGSEGFLFAAVPTLSVNIEWTIPQQQLLVPLQQAIANSEVVQQRRAEAERQRKEQATQQEKQRQAKLEKQRREAEIEKQRKAEAQKQTEQKRALEAKRQAAAAKKREAERQARLAKEKRQRRAAEQRRLKALEEMDEIIIGDNKSTIDQAAVTALLAKSSPQWAARFSRTLEIDANLSLATVTVDGKSYGEQSLPYRIQLLLGAHRVELSGSGYRTSTEEHTLNVGGSASVEQIWLTLNKEPVAYTLQGEQLNGSTIKVDGHRKSSHYRGEGLELEWGKSYQLEVAQKGYQPYQERITVYRPGKGSNQHRVKLEEKGPLTKLDGHGKDLADNATKWSCVKDNVSGLIWEVKTDDGGIHDKDNTYRWGGVTALGRDHRYPQRKYYDDWNELVKGANRNRFCSYRDWRVPTREELRSLGNLKRTDPEVYADYFPRSGLAWFWSSSPYASNSSNAWIFSFDVGYDDYYYRGNVSHVRLVRGGQ